MSTTSLQMGFPAVRARAVLIILMLIDMSVEFARAGPELAPYAQFTWTEARATFYGGRDAAGTMGGACGYGNLYQAGYGVQTAALSSVLFGGGLTCGSCFEIRCRKAESKWCHPAAGSVTITATNLCPANWARTTDGWCNPPQAHFDMAYPMFAQLAERVAGVIPIEYRRVPCIKTGGVRFTMNGNYWFMLVLVYNIGGAGNAIAVQMKGSDPEFNPMDHNWGGNWELRKGLVGQEISFKVTLGNFMQLTSWNVAPPHWKFGQTFECLDNFHKL